MCEYSLFWSLWQVTEKIICHPRFRVHCLVMHLFGIFMIMCHKLFWLCTTLCRPGTDMMTCVSKQTCLAAQHRVLGCLSHGLSTHDMAWHLDLASTPWPGYLLCPLSHLLLGTRWTGIEAGAFTIVAWVGCLSATLKDRLSAGPADLTSGCIVHQSILHPVTVPADHEQGGKSSNWFLLKGYFTFFVDWPVSPFTSRGISD